MINGKKPLIVKEKVGSGRSDTRLVTAQLRMNALMRSRRNSSAR